MTRLANLFARLRAAGSFALAQRPEYDVDYDLLYREDAIAADPDAARRGAQADYSSVLGKRLRVTTLHSPEAELSAPAGRHFVVRITETPPADIVHWADDEFLDPYWNIEVLSGHDLVPPGVDPSWIYGRTWHIPRTAPTQAS